MVDLESRGRRKLKMGKTIVTPLPLETRFGEKVCMVLSIGRGLGALKRSKKLRENIICHATAQAIRQVTAASPNEFMLLYGLSIVPGTGDFAS